MNLSTESFGSKGLFGYVLNAKFQGSAEDSINDIGHIQSVPIASEVFAEF